MSIYMTSYLSTLHKNPKSVISVGPDPIPLKRAVWLGPDCTWKWPCYYTDLRNISQMCFNFFFCWCRMPIIFCKQPGPGSGQADMVGPGLAPICLPPRSPTLFQNGKMYVRWQHGICLRPFGSAPLRRSKTDGFHAEDAGTLVLKVRKFPTFRRK